MKTVLFSAGEYSDYYVKAVVEMPDGMSLEVMWDQFRDPWMLDDRKKYRTSEAWYAHVDEKRAVMKAELDAYRARGYQGANAAEVFLSTLGKHYGLRVTTRDGLEDVNVSEDGL